MRKFFIYWLVFLSLLMIFSCSVQPTKTLSDSSNILINENLNFSLLPAFSIEKKLSLTQTVQIQYASKQYDFISLIEISNHSFKLVGLTSTGIKLFSIESNNDTYRFESSPFIGDDLNLAYLLADLQLAYWPADQLNLQLQKNNARIKIKKQQRLVIHNDSPVINIQFSNNQRWNKNIVFKHLQRNYSVTINTLAMEYL